MSNFIIVKKNDLTDGQQNSPVFDLPEISIKELSFMHLSAMKEILSGNQADLNKKLYRATKSSIDNHMDSLLGK